MEVVDTLTMHRTSIKLNLYISMIHTDVFTSAATHNQAMVINSAREVIQSSTLRVQPGGHSCIIKSKGNPAKPYEASLVPNHNQPTHIWVHNVRTQQ